MMYSSLKIKLFKVKIQQFKLKIKLFKLIIEFLLAKKYLTSLKKLDFKLLSGLKSLNLKLELNNNLSLSQSRDSAKAVELRP